MAEIQKRLPLYESEMASLLSFLKPVLGEKVYYTVEEKGYVARVHTESGETVGRIRPYPKGKNRRRIYILVELEDHQSKLDIWFRLAFLGFRVSFTRPPLFLKIELEEKPRGP